MSEQEAAEALAKALKALDGYRAIANDSRIGWNIDYPRGGYYPLQADVRSKLNGKMGQVLEQWLAETVTEAEREVAIARTNLRLAMDRAAPPTNTEVKPLWSPKFHWSVGEGSVDRFIAGSVEDTAQAAKDAAERAGFVLEDSLTAPLGQRKLRVWCGAMSWHMTEFTYPKWVSEGI